MPEPLRDDQIEDLAFYINNPRCGNLSDPGTGKTPSVCVYIEYLFKHKNTKTIWSMPKSLLRKNYRELLRFTNLLPEQCIIVDGTPKEREQQINDPRGVVWLMGFKRFADDWDKMRAIHPTIDALIFDEFHMGGFKKPTSARSLALFIAMRKMKYFLPMTGTLIAGRLDSCYSAIHVIEPRYYSSHSSFMAQHSLQDADGNIMAWVNHEKLGRIFLRHTIRRSFESVHGKQVIVTQKELIPMDSKTYDAYKEFEAKAILELDDSFLDGSNPGVNAIRCRQIMAHPQTFGILKPGELTGKDERLQIHVEDHLNNGTPLIIFGALIPEQERVAELCEKWGLKVGLINSHVSSKMRSIIDEDFIAGKLNCVVASQGTASVGFNWGHVDHIINVSIDYEDTNFIQSFRRATRSARTKPLRITLFEYENSIDKRVFQIVDRKSRDLNKVDSSYPILNLSAEQWVNVIEKKVENNA